MQSAPAQLTYEEVAGRLRIVVNRLQRRLRQESLGGLSPAQASALGSVRRHGSPTLGELAAIEQVQPPSMTRIVANLTEAGMVTRVADANDRRSARVRVTPAGERALEQIRTRKNAFLLRRLGELTADEQQQASELVGLLEHILAEEPVTRLRAAGRRTFRAISVRNYRLYFTGQVISVSGTWMQSVAQAYLILFALHGTGVDVAVATSLQFLPLLLLGPFGGLIADRLDKRKVLYATQGTAGTLALILGILTVTHSVSLWEVYVLAAGLGFVNLFDNPARQTFVSEMVGLELLPNAVSLNSVLMNSARVIGPAIGGVLILTVGVSTCFFVNAASFAAVITALAMMRAAELYQRPGVVRAKGQVRAGFRYVWSTPDLKIPLISMAVVGVFAFNLPVTLPLLAKFTFHGGPGLYSWFLVAMGAGAVLGGLATAFRSRPSTRLLAFIGVVFGAAILAVALSPSETWAIALLVLMGAASIAFVATNNATLQLRADPAMRGRVMALNAIAFLGSTPIGAPLLGYISDTTNPRVALAVGGVATALASIPLFALGARQRRRGTEGLVMAQEGEAATVVQLPLREPGTAYETPRLRSGESPA